MLPEDIGRYLSEIYRALKPGGRCLATCYLINHEFEKDIEVGQSTYNFTCKIDNSSASYYALDPDILEYTIAFDEDELYVLGKANSLEVESTQYGSWSGRSAYRSFQDIIVWMRPH